MPNSKFPDSGLQIHLNIFVNGVVVKASVIIFYCLIQVMGNDAHLMVLPGAVSLR